MPSRLDQVRLIFDVCWEAMLFSTHFVQLKSFQFSIPLIFWLTKTKSFQYVLNGTDRTRFGDRVNLLVTHLVRKAVSVPEELLQCKLRHRNQRTPPSSYKEERFVFFWILSVGNPYATFPGEKTTWYSLNRRTNIVKLGLLVRVLVHSNAPMHSRRLASSRCPLKLHPNWQTACQRAIAQTPTNQWFTLATQPRFKRLSSSRL